MERLSFTPLSPQLEPLLAEQFEALFNPESYSVSKTVNWTAAAANNRLNAPLLNFGGGGSRVLSLNLFYDVTEPMLRRTGPVFADDVREETARMVRLTRIREGQQPPIVDVDWGAAPPDDADFPFRGVVTSLNQNFTLFSPAGKPLRAELSVSLTEFDGTVPRLEDDMLRTAVRVVSRGAKLAQIAGQHLKDPAQWRAIAEANNIDDPRKLATGLRLKVPGA